ncbi:MAG: 50S ribosomal protein L7ae [Ruminococcaceae bacterium]|nr:50S ribosomal protein L7ae [Oscillospiraceae bacterium]
MNNDIKKRLCGMIGLCARARKLAIGSDIAIEAAKSGKADLLLVAEDASANSVKKIFNCAKYYEVSCCQIPVTISELGHFVGKEGNIAAVAVLDRNMIKGIEKILNETNKRIEANEGLREV